MAWDHDKEPLDTYKQDEIVCPYCGHEHRDSCEHEKDSGQVWCDACGKPFRYEREIEVSYTTTQINP